MSDAVHVLEVIVKPGNTDRLQKTMQQEVRHILNRQPGFKGVITFADKGEPRSVLILSFWTKVDDAKKVSSNLCRLIRPLLDVDPKVSLYSSLSDASERSEFLSPEVGAAADDEPSSDRSVAHAAGAQDQFEESLVDSTAA